MSLGSWRAVLRIARRDALRAKGRSALIVAMIAIPVLGMSAADVTWRSVQLDTDETISRSMGTADAWVQDVGGGIGGSAMPGGIRQTPDATEYRPAGMDTSGRPPASRSAVAMPEPDPATTEPPRDPGASIPGVTERLTDRHSFAAVSTAHGRTSAQIREFDYAEPLAKGMVFQRKGRAPATADEVVVTEALRKTAGYRVGGQLVELSTGRTFRIVGTVDLPNSLNDQTVIARPGSMLDTMRGLPGTARIPPTEDRMLVRVPGGVSWSEVLEANKQGVVVKSAHVLAHPPAASQVPRFDSPQQWIDSRELRLAGIGLGLGLLEMVLLAGPAFAVGARRKRRELGLIGVAGGSRRHIGGVVLAGGVVLGAVGAIVGTGLGLIAAAALRGWFAERSGKILGRYDAHAVELLGIGAVGVAVGVAAALIPAWLAAREDIAASLTGRRGVRGSSRVLPTVGTAVTALGVAVAMFGSGAPNDEVILAGVVLAELGLVACCPALIGATAKLGRFLPLSPRLALRDAARSRTRSAPAVAAVMAAVAGSVVIAVLWQSETQDNRNRYRAGGPANHVLIGFPGRTPSYGSPFEEPPLTQAQAQEARRTVEDLLPATKGSTLGVPKGACTPDGSCVDFRPEKLPEFLCPMETGRPMTDDERMHLIGDPRCSSGHGGYFMSVVGDAEALRRLTGANDPRAADVLSRGGIVLFEPGYVAPDGTVAVRALEGGRPEYPPGMAGGPEHAVSQPAVPEPVHRVPAVEIRAPFPPGVMFLSSEAARTIGARVEPAGLVYDAGEPPSDAKVQALEDRMAKISGQSFVFVERGFQGKDDARMLLLAVFALVVTVGASGVATGLALADSQKDLATLGSVGAPPGVRRRLSAFQSGVIAFLGTVLGLGAGLLAGVVVRRGQRSSVWDAMPDVAKRDLHAPETVIPWAQMGVALVVLPLLAALLAALLTRSRAMVRGRTA
ncbi:FtsX-like permease family protein [Streptomyces sp. SID3343]|uniref:FtsX-like permease family protein n=1 Tax=Streptomyces sp. SID3343 TaxID=2690260 RepID=UPI00136B2BB2|nr:FtsX-like permease family protein [Streptomyces sp. SID3343]MYV96844.1 FtsX-like permease family protein [Streptomyces sp. SID3343]